MILTMAPGAAEEMPTQISAEKTHSPILFQWSVIPVMNRRRRKLSKKLIRWVIRKLMKSFRIS